MAKVFVSYSRKDIEFAKRLTGELQKSDLDFWIDWEGIPPTVDWWKEIQKGIEEADIFLFLISPDSVKSKVCNQEIDYAVINGKRLIPLVVWDIQTEEAPAKLASLNWIFFRASDNFETALSKLFTAVHTDYQWVQIHRRLQVRALEWERNNHENSFLLRGKDLQDAETQISANIAKDPKPTELQTQYIHTSRQAESRRQRNLLLGVGIALVISLGLGLLAFINGQNATKNANDFATQVVIAEAEANFRATEQARAEEQTRIALSRSLATASRLNFDKQYDLSLLMAVESLNLDDSIEAKAALFDGLGHIPEALTFINLDFQTSSDYLLHLGGLIDFSADGRYLAARYAGSDVFVMDLEGGGSQTMKLPGHGSNIMTLQFNVAKDELYSLDESGVLITWDMERLQPKNQLQIPLRFNEELAGISEPLVAISKTGELVAIVNYDEISVWNILTNSLTRTIFPNQALGGMPVTVLTFSPDGSMVAAGAFYRAAAWEIETGEEVPNGTIDTSRPVTGLAISPDGTLLAAGSSDGFVHLKSIDSGEQISQPPPSYGVDITTGQEVTTDISGHRDDITALAFSPDNQTIVSASNDQTFIAWNSGHWPVLGPVDIHHDPIIGIAFNPVNGVMASIDTDGTVIVWDISKSSRLFKFADNDELPLDLTDGQQLAPEDCSRIVNHLESSCFVSPNGKVMISYYLLEAYGAYLNVRTLDSVIEIWDFETEQLIGQHTAAAYEPEWVAFSTDNKYARMIGNSYGNPFLVIDIDFSTWASLACAVANRSFSEVEWVRYLGEIPYRPTCQ
jgi:WD40 repeat protein